MFRCERGAEILDGIAAGAEAEAELLDAKFTVRDATENVQVNSRSATPREALRQDGALEIQPGVARRAEFFSPKRKWVLMKISLDGALANRIEPAQYLRYRDARCAVFRSGARSGFSNLSHSD